MIRIVPALLIALSALVASPIAAQDAASMPGLVALPDVEIGQDATAPVFVNDANTAASAAVNAAPVSNGFSAGLPEVRSYEAPQLTAPLIEGLPQPVPQNEAEATITSLAQPAAEPSVASDADLTAVQPIAAFAVEPTVASDAESSASQPSAEYFPVSASQPVTAAAFPAPNEERAAVDEARPVAVIASAAPTEDRVASALSIAEAPASVVAAAVPEATTSTPTSTSTPTPTEATSKASNFKQEGKAENSNSSDHGASIAGIFAAGVACALAIAGVVYARKRKLVFAKTPGTPKNELTFFHVQSRLTPPAV